MVRKVASALLLSLWAILLVAVPVFAAYVYYAPYTVNNAGDVGHTMLAVYAESPNGWMADNGFMLATALDTTIETLGGLASPHMVTDTRTLTAVAVPANSQVNLLFTTGNDPALPTMDIIAGKEGRVETLDAAALEPGQDFDIEFDGYVDMAAVHHPLIYKPGNGGLLIDVSAAGTINASIINVDSYDVTPGVFAAWTDVDVSNYVPDEATGVVVEIDTANAAKQTGVRMNGSTDDRRTDTERYWAMIGIDDDEIFEVYLEDNTSHIYIRAYTGGSWVFNTNADDVSLAAATAWTDVDISTEAPNAVGAIIEIVNANVAHREANVRMNGSTDARTPDLGQNNHVFRVVGLDSAQIFEGYVEALDVDFYLIGYVTGGATFATNGTNKSLGASGAWTNVDCSVEAPGATFLFFEYSNPAVASDLGTGYREEGWTIDSLTTDSTYGQGQGIVKCDVNQVVEAYEEDHNNTQSYLIGYTEYGIYPAYPDPTFAVVATVGAGALTDGEYTILTSGTGGGGNLVLDVDGATNSAAIGAGVTNTTENWRLLPSPSWNYYEHSVASVLIVDYEPITMILGDTLPDKQGAAQNGTLCWGDHPLGVSVPLGSMVSVSQPTVGETEEDETIDILPAVDTSDWFVDPDVTGTLLTNPVRPLVTMLSDNTTLSEIQAWRLYALAFILLVTVGVARAVRSHLILSGVAAGASIGGAVALTVFPLWALVFAIGAVLGGVVAERSPSL